MIHVFNFTGETEFYNEAWPKISSLINQYIADPEGHYIRAVKEAVFNGFCYSLAPSGQEEVTVKIYFSADDVTTTVIADTSYFEPETIRRNYVEIGRDPKLKNTSWPEYIKTLPVNKRSRGFWSMLMSCEYIYLNTSGKKISLVARYPFDKKQIVSEIGIITSRFLLEKNGVIF